MEEKTFTIPKISCGHCVMTIKNGLGDIGGVKSVEGDPENKQVTVQWDAPMTLEKIQETLKEMNYPATL
jgi:copper chaperone CopZ